MADRVLQLTPASCVDVLWHPVTPPQLPPLSTEPGSLPSSTLRAVRRHVASVVERAEAFRARSAEANPLRVSAREVSCACSAISVD